MFLRKKRMVMLLMLSIVLLLAACGSKEGNSEVSSQKSSPATIPFSEALEEYSVWIGTNDKDLEELNRDTSIDFIFVFKNGNVKYYDYRTYEKYRSASTIGEITKVTMVDESLTIEDVTNMSDKEIVKHAEENAAEEINLGEYSLNVLLDDNGNYTKKEELITQNEPKFNDTMYTDISFSKEFFGKNFAGMSMHGLPTGKSWTGGFLLTRTDDFFKLDSPDTKKKNVTIEAE
ncbi:hypothetical protein SFC55_26100 [Niallia taxi]|uniref:hypothetical protein n=1 Tax=Niallia taxi TaxID=2499688 RepID=UPI00398287E5